MESRRRDVVKDKFLHKVVSFRKPRSPHIGGGLPPAALPGAFYSRGAAPGPVRLLERKRSKELAFFIWRVLLFLGK